MPAIIPTGPQVRIRPFRVVAGLTLEQLAERIGGVGVEVDISHLSRIETGKARASDRLLRAWALALGIDPLDVYQPDSPVTEVTDALTVTQDTRAA